jgi:signal transduction histidine kinase
VRLGCTLALLALLSPLVEAAPKHVLILHSFGRDFTPFNTVAPAFRTELAQLAPQPVVFHEASLDAERAGPPEKAGPFIDFLRNRYDGAQPDLVVTMGAPAAHFHLRHRARLFPEVAWLVTGLDQRTVQAVDLRTEDRIVAARFEIPRMVQSILQLFPDTTTLAVVLGASPLEQFWMKEVQRDLAPLSGRLRLLPLHGLTLEQVRSRVAALPAGSAVFYGLFAVGADGVPHEGDQALAAVRQASAAPVFGVFESQLGKGIVGGPLLDARQVGTAAARVAARMLQGEAVSGASAVIEMQVLAFDWRELHRWRIPESRLPAGAEVRFRPPSLWEQHRAVILAGAAIVLLQAALISALLLQHARRRRAEKETVDLGGRLLTAHEDERRRLARELHDDLSQRLARAAIDAGRMENAPAAPEGMHPLREDLVRLSEDVHALSYRLHPSVLDDLGLVEALKAECDRVARHAALRVEVNARGVPEALPGDASLCLFRVAQEALSNAARHAGASAVTVLLSPSGKGVQLAVSDNGSGFDPALPRSRASLGLASMRERVRLLRGELDIESTPGRGTTVVAWVPA